MRSQSYKQINMLSGLSKMHYYCVPHNMYAAESNLYLKLKFLQISRIHDPKKIIMYLMCIMLAHILCTLLLYFIV